jgi:hypothetical protein
MYANFGLPGVMIGSVLFGALIELLSRRLARSTSIRESVFVAVCTEVPLDIFTRGDFASMFISFVGILLAAALVCRRGSPVLAAAGPPDASKPTGTKIARRPVVTP